MIAEMEYSGYHAAYTGLRAYRARHAKIQGSGAPAIFERRTDCHRVALRRAVRQHGLLHQRRKNLPTRRAEHPLFFVGRAATISSILTFSLQALWLGELLKGNFQLPSVKTITRDIEEMKAWKRSWMPFSPARSARLIVHMQHYHDELVRDFGASPWCKTGAFAPLKELISPYEPRDYASIVVGEKRGDAPSKTAHEVDYL